MLVSFGRGAGSPPVELDARIGTDTKFQGTQVAAGGARGTGAAATLSVAAGLDTLGHGRRPVIPELALEAVKLFHEVEVRSYVGFTAAHQVKCVVQVQAALVHEVGDGYRDRARYTSDAVDQYTLVRVPGFL